MEHKPLFKEDLKDLKRLYYNKKSTSKINCYQRDKKFGERLWSMVCNRQAVKHSGGSVMAWICMAASGTASQIFIHYVTYAYSNKII